VVRALSSSEQTEFENLKRFLMALAQFRDTCLGSPVSMVACLERVFAHAPPPSPLESLAGLRDAAHDMVVWSRHLPADLVRQADAYLEERGAITLTTMARRYDKLVPKILERGRIRTDDEFYIIKELLNDTSECGLQGRDRARGERMVTVYESKSRKA
jgi:hypothetical protein